MTGAEAVWVKLRGGALTVDDVKSREKGFAAPSKQVRAGKYSEIRIFSRQTIVGGFNIISYIPGLGPIIMTVIAEELVTRSSSVR